MQKKKHIVKAKKNKRFFLFVLGFSLGLSLTMPEASQSVDVVADASVSHDSFDNIAAGINFWGTEEMRQRFTNEIGQKLFRLKLLLDQVEWDQDTDTYNNYRLGMTAGGGADVLASANLAAEAGCKILVQIYGVPKWLSTSKDDRIVIGKLPNYTKYPPRNYYQWAQMVCAGIQALKRAGLDKIDYCEIFGEPNCGTTWYQQMMPCIQNGQVVWDCEPNQLGHNTFQIMENFLRIYKYTAMGVQAAEPDVLVGGPAIVPNTSGIWWTRYLLYFLGHYSQPVDFVSWHWYGVDEVLSSALDMIAPYKPLTPGAVESAYRVKLENQGFPPEYVSVFLHDIHDYFKELEVRGAEAVRWPHSFVSSNLNRIMNEEGYGSTELLLTEWNVNHSFDRRHDTHYGASYIVRALMDITDSATTGQTYHYLGGGNYYNDNGYGGFWSLFTLNGTNTPKASFNALKLYSMLGDNTTRILVTSSDDNVYAIATQDETEVSLLATYYVMANDPANPDYSLSTSVTLRATNLPFNSYRYDIYLIDGNHSNSYYGSGPELEITDSKTGLGDFEKTMTLDVYGVVLVKIEQSL